VVFFCQAAVAGKSCEVVGAGWIKDARRTSTNATGT
jgi:hypothetical protein